MKSTIPSRIWETKRVLITKLYEEEEWPLKQVIKALQSKDFHPSETQLRSRLKKWHVTKPSRKKWSTSKRPTSEERTAPERCASRHEDPSSMKNATHNSLCPGPACSSPSPLASQGLQALAGSETPCFSAAGTFIQPLTYTHAIADGAIDFQTSRLGRADLRFASQPTPTSPRTEHGPGASMYRWPTCLHPAGLEVATSALPTGADPWLPSSAHPPMISCAMGYSPSGRIYGTDPNHGFADVGGYPVWVGPYEAYSVAYPSSKVSCLQPSFWPTGNQVVSDGNGYQAQSMYLVDS